MRSRVDAVNDRGASPRTQTSPDVVASEPISIRMVVVLPEPDGPTTPRIDPRPTVRSIPPTATVSPNRRVRPAVRTTTSGESGATTGEPSGTASCRDSNAAAGPGVERLAIRPLVHSPP